MSSSQLFRSLIVLGQLSCNMGAILRQHLDQLYTYAQREVWSFIQSVQVSLMIFALEGSYHYSS